MLMLAISPGGPAISPDVSSRMPAIAPKVNPVSKHPFAKDGVQMHIEHTCLSMMG